MFQNNPVQMVSYKIMILYAVKTLGQDVQKADLTDFFMFYDYMNFFEFQQYLSELVEAGLMLEIATQDGFKLLLTDAGQSTLDFFSDRLDRSTKRELEWRLEIERNKKRVPQKPDGKYIKDQDQNHFAELRILSGTKVDFYLKVMVEDRESAEALISRWYDRFETMSKEIKAWRLLD